MIVKTGTTKVTNTSTIVRTCGCGRRLFPSELVECGRCNSINANGTKLYKNIFIGILWRLALIASGIGAAYLVNM